MTSVAELIESQVVRTVEAVRLRGTELEKAGAVQLVRFAPLVVTAEVDDAAAHVELTVVEGSLRWFCTCREGRAGAFCVHCVATALATRRRAPARPHR
ncbi:hypothetical protein Misp01_39450 [Microtetraspora sp. NBRC 13810]|uniref:hypothetical protein n=1 Tax=Microtetraspora sp. NBRC 13810 TaxID=3030990 RepID=UPI002554E5EC|nr:hypothetical protein [Microtetraspora sp. NBRC 13810]GLW08815.1 hypothetical protein Misp01_39450 [Microtetraspora sp. NBRC 13810]